MYRMSGCAYVPGRRIESRHTTGMDGEALRARKLRRSPPKSCCGQCGHGTKRWLVTGTTGTTETVQYSARTGHNTAYRHQHHPATVLKTFPCSSASRGSPLPPRWRYRSTAAPASSGRSCGGATQAHPPLLQHTVAGLLRSLVTLVRVVAP